MNQEMISVMHECCTRSLRGEITFPEVVRKLQAIGVERYHADFSRHEITYYLLSGESHIEPAGWHVGKLAEVFSANAVGVAVKQIQKGEILYTEFLHEIMAAGCVGYFVQITGRRVLYFGRDGGFHLEPFPSAPRAQP